MKKSKTKLIIIISIIVIVSVIVAVGAVLYFTTDIFRSNQELFYKYIAQNDEVLELLQKDSNEQNVESTLQASKYTTKGEVNFQLTSNDAQIANQAIPPRNFSIQYEGKTDGLNQKASSQTTLKYLSKDLFTVKYIRKEDTYALKSDEVISKYLAVENNNLRELYKKFNIEQVEQLPNQIESLNSNDLLAINEQDKTTILQNYMQVIDTTISKDRYTKRKDVTITINDKSVIANEYAITLTKTEVHQLAKQILQTLQTDDTTLNLLLAKAKMIAGDTTDITDLKQGIQNILTQLEEVVIQDDNEVQIRVYEVEGQLVRTYVGNAEDIAIILDITRVGNAKSVLISFEYNYENIQENATVLKSIEVAKKTQGTDTEKDYIFVIEKGDNTTKVAIQDKLNNNLASGSVDRNIIINFDLSNITYFTIKVANTTTLVDSIEVEELTDENSVKVNDFTPEYANQLFNAIVKRINYLFVQKVQLITTTQQEENQQSTTQPNNTQNSNGVTENQTT